MSVFRELRERLRGVFAPRTGEDTRRPDGGTSCYRPIRRRTQDETEFGRTRNSEPAPAEQSIPYIHTGFTDMNPPTGGDYTGILNDPYGYGAAQAARQAQVQAQAQAQAPAGREANISSIFW